MLSTYFNKFLCHSISIYVIPMEMGIHLIFLILHPWIPAFAGMTEGGVSFKLWFCALHFPLFAIQDIRNIILYWPLYLFSSSLTLRSTLNAPRYLPIRSTLYANFTLRSTLSFYFFLVSK